MTALHHYHRGGDRPHIHRGDGDHRRADHEELHLHVHHRPRGYHAYDTNGRQLAIVAGDSHELGHWHFAAAFENATFAPTCEPELELADFLPVWGVDGLYLLPLAPRPPPAHK